MYLPGQAHDGEVVAETAELVSAPAATGVDASESVARVPSSGELAFAANGSDCEFFREPSGTINIVRLRRKIVEKHLHVAFCTTGIGTPPPDVSHEPHQFVRLGITAVAQIAVFDVPYEFTAIVLDCDAGRPAP